MSVKRKEGGKQNMSFEEQLKQEFKRHSKHLSCPPTLDTRINTSYRNHFLEKRGKGKMHNKVFFKKGIIIALVFLLLSGFAYGGLLLFHAEKGNISMNYTAYKDLSLDKGTLDKVRASLKDIRNQLQTGEMAVVYVSELDNKKEISPYLSLLAVAKPKIINQKQAWQQELMQQHININIPNTIAGTYHFIGGKKTPAFGVALGTDEVSLKDELMAESKKTGKDIVWEKATPTKKPIVQSYTTIYQDEHQGEIYYTIQLASEKVRMEGKTSASSQYNAMDINGNQVNYLRNEQSLYGNSNEYQSIIWMTTQGDQTYIHTVSTDSTKITKEQLKAAAKNF